MELSPSQIAKLVLGYLKIEKCPGAYYDFLHNCQHFKSPAKRKQKKYIVTRVNGLSLSEILHDYARMYTIIQGRLEATDYFNARHNSNRIVPQLLYLLDNVITSGSTTPYTHYGSRSPTPTDGGSPTNYRGDVQQAPELSATSLKSLPGHNGNADGSSNKENDSFDEPNNGSHRLEAAVQTFAQTLLEHPELQEKIADNINRVRHPTEKDQSKDRSGSDDIDAAIKAVLDRTESDPVFESFMGEIIGTVAETTSTSSVEKDKQNVPQSTSTPCNSLHSMIEAQNRSAIDSIISASQNVGEQPTNKVPPPPSSSEVIFCEATGQFVLNQTSVVPAKNNNQSAGTMMTSHYPATTIESMKPYLVFNTQQPQQLTEQDIMSMPTVILCDDRNEKAILLDGQQQSYIKPQQPPPPVKTKKEAETNTDLITIYTMDDKNSSMKSPLKHCKTIKSIKKKQISINRTVVVNTIEPESSNVPTIEILDSEATPSDDGKDQKRSSTPRSGGRSHVRALDFNFRTPIKDVVEVKEKKAPDGLQAPPPKSAKSLFKTETVKKSLGSWDADLRAVIPATAAPSPPKKKPCPKPKKPASAKKGKKKKAVAAVKVEEKPSVVHLQLSENEHIKIRNFNAKAAYRRKCNIEGSVLLQPNAKPDDPIKVEIKAELAKIQSTKFEVRSEPVAVEVRHEPEAGDAFEARPDPVKSEIRSEPVEFEVRSAKCDARSETANFEVRSAKCDVRSETADFAVTSDSVKCEIRSETANFEVRSDPTKCEVRSEPVKSEVRSNPTEFEVRPDTAKCDVRSVDFHDEVGPPDVKPAEFLAPETTKPLDCSKNAMPILETPVKQPPDCPKTPGYYSPADVSFSTIIKENLRDVDLTSIATPKFPLTPNFPFTPFLEGQSSHSNRATDYSTSSSYYQPSDTEQSKSLEKIIIEECKRLERKKVPTSKGDGDGEAAVAVVKTEAEEVKVEVATVVDEKVETPECPEKAIAEKMKSLRSNVIGRKNLSLMREKTDAPPSDGSSSDSDSESSTSNSSSSVSWAEPLDRSASHDTSVSHYSLRSKAKDSSAELVENEKKIDRILQSTEYKPNLFEKAEDTDDKVEQQKKKVLLELEEKRKRTIAKFKSEPAPEAVEAKPKKAPAAPKKRNLRSNSVKAPTGTKRTARMASIDVPTEQAPKTPKKGRNSTPKTKAARKEVAIPKEEATEEKPKEEEKKTPDQEAEELVKGLKERGIHLVHKSQEKVAATEAKKEAPKTKAKAPSKSKESKAKDKANDNVKKDKANENAKKDKAVDNAKKDKASDNNVKGKTKASEKTKPQSKKSDTTKPAKPKPNTNKPKAVNKAPAIKPETPNPTITAPPQTTPKIVSTPIVTTKPDDDSGFSVRTYADEIRAYHDPTTAVTRAFAYDADFFRRKLKLCSYDEADNPINLTLSYTPFESVLDVRSKPVRVLSDVKIGRKSRPLKMLYNQLLPTTTQPNVATPSPLDDLYAASPNPTGNRYRNQKSTKVDDAKDDGKRPTEPVIDDKEDELMNYAIIGSDRKVNDSPVFDKRKRNSESLDDDVVDKKKIKTEKELLNELNVEAFLKKLHGE